MSYICEWKSTGGLPKGNFHPLFQEADSLKPTYQRVCREGKVKKEREKKDISYPFHDTEADKSTLPPKILLTASTIPQSAPPFFTMLSPRTPTTPRPPRSAIALTPAPATADMF